MLLLVFILICGVHLAGIHHDADSDGLGLVDRLVAILLVAALGLALIGPSPRRSEGSSDASPAHNEIFPVTAVDASHFRIVGPLRC